MVSMAELLHPQCNFFTHLAEATEGGADQHQRSYRHRRSIFFLLQLRLLLPPATFSSPMLSSSSSSRLESLPLLLRLRPEARVLVFFPHAVTSTAAPLISLREVTVATVTRAATRGIAGVITPSSFLLRQVMEASPSSMNSGFFFP